MPGIRRLIGSALVFAAAGCGTTRMTDTQRTATEQLLVSNAIDQAVSQLGIQDLAGKPVFFDAQYLDGVVDRGYLVSSIRQHLLASGCLLQEERAKADYVVEARSGGVGTNRNALLIGVPQMNVPALVPGQPSSIPEIPLAKKTDQEGVAKIAVFAYNRRTGQPLWQSGVVQANSTAKDTWVLGAGPFQQGSVRKRTEFAGEPLAIPAFGSKESPAAPGAARVAVTESASWAAPPTLVTVSGRPALLADLRTVDEPVRPRDGPPAAAAARPGEAGIARGTAWTLLHVGGDADPAAPEAQPAPVPFLPPVVRVRADSPAGSNPAFDPGGVMPAAAGGGEPVGFVEVPTKPRPGF
jgi:hypothetical protein